MPRPAPGDAGMSRTAPDDAATPRTPPGDAQTPRMAPDDAATPRTAPDGAQTPRSTYRVQVRPGFDFAAAAGIAGYLADLGITHLYSAPMLEATPGSQHGYDVVEHRVSAQLGGEAGRVALVSALREHGLGLVVDIVPNHMGVARPEVNRAWWDVLRHGPDSDYAAWFDIDWSAGQVMLPVLGDDSLDGLSVTDGELRYAGHRFPCAPGTADGDPVTVHSRQHYQLVSWRRCDELNYRRFFAISDLAGLRVEDDAVFDATHAEILGWYAVGDVDGIRVDHPDGLVDPAGYLRRLRTAAPEAWLVVEKILEPGEDLPDWPVAGTTGYDALREVGGLFTDPAGEAALTDRAAYDAVVLAAKRDVATGMLRAEYARLGRLCPDVPDAGPALAELAAAFAVYRSYLPDGLDQLAQAAVTAARRRPELAPSLDALLPRLSVAGDELASRFQQYTGPVMAKGVEDTAFYRYTELLAANEVGGSPTRAALGVEEFHTACAGRQARYPDGMTTLSTHDTKRGEDVRARLLVLAEMPDEWRSTLAELRRLAPIDDPAVSALVWQTFVGAWPIEPDRMHAVLEKSAREARTATCWDEPDADFEAGLHAAIDRVYTDPDLGAVVTAFAARITPYGWVNALGQKLVQLTMPGVPDVYQGCELWDNSLVDPDNRRPVDFGPRREMLSRLESGWLPPIDATGAVKLLVTSRALRLRRDRPELFTRYTPIAATGPAAEHAVAYDRGGALTVATRLPFGLARRHGWRDTTLALPDGQWTDAYTSRAWAGTVPLSDLLATYPIALLARA